MKITVDGNSLTGGPPSNRLTATLLAQYYGCPLRAYNYAHSSELRLEPDALRRLIMERGQEKEAEIVAAYRPEEVRSDPKDPRKGAEQTLALMREGRPAIYQPVFYAADGQFEYVARPDLIVLAPQPNPVPGDGADRSPSPFPPLPANPGPSCPPYQVIEIKHSRAATSEHVIQLVFSAELLNLAQGTRVESHQLLLSGRQPEVHRLSDYRGMVFHLVREACAVMRSPKPPVFAANRLCRTCEWRRACFQRAEEADLPGRIFGITLKELDCLDWAGIRTLSEIPDKRDSVQQIEEITADRRDLISSRAVALTARKDFRVRPAPPRANPFLLHLAKDQLDEKDIIAFIGSFRKGPVQRCMGQPETVKARLAALFSTAVPLRDVIATTELSQELLRNEVIAPLLGPANPKIITEIPHLTSLEGIAARTLALNLDIYDFIGLGRHFQVITEGFLSPEQVHAEEGAGAPFDAACDRLLQIAWRLYDALNGVTEVARG